MPNIIKPSGINQLWASGGTKVDPGLQKLNIGWVVELPPYQYQNWLDNRQDTFIAHINQHGIPEWDAETEYQGNLSYSQGADGYIYKCLVTNTNFNPINPLNTTYWARAFETYGSVAVVQNALNAHLTNYATLSGISNPVAARNNLSVFSKTESDVRFAALAGNTSQIFNVADAVAPTHAVPLGQLSTLLLTATESTAGQIAIATLGETESGTNDTKAITPAKGQAVYLKKSGNLSGLASASAARSNLGLGDIAVESTTSFLRASNNLSELTNTGVARNNLGLGTIATMSAAAFLQTANNLSDLSNVTTARNNLGLQSTATTPLTSFLLKSDNLAGLTNVAQARLNLGLGNASVLDQSQIMFRANNLGDVTNTQAARNNLGLGSASTRNVIGVPGDLNFSSSLGVNGWQRLPSGLIEQWGYANINGGTGAQTSVGLHIPMSIFNVQLTYGSFTDADGDSCYAHSFTTSNFVVGQYGRANTVYWRALGA